MEIIEHSQSRLSLKDTEKDKQVGLVAAAIFIGIVSGIFAFEGGWSIAGFGLLISVALIIASRVLPVTATVTIDRSANLVKRSTSGKDTSKDFECALSDVKHAAVSHAHVDADEAGIESLQCPQIILKNGEHYLLREYHSAGTQSRDVVALINEFLRESAV